MASGFSKRFGKNKLLEVVNGKTLIEHAIAALPLNLRAHAVIVTQYDEVAQIAQQHNLPCIRNLQPEMGISHTIKLGIQALGNRQGYLFMVCDQPYLTANSVLKLLNTFHFYPKNIVCLACTHPLGHIERGNPVIFPASLAPDLLALTGEQSGSTVIKQHNLLIKYCMVDAHQLQDMDTQRTQAAKNLLVTGVRNVGKSTLVGCVLHSLCLPYSGYCTYPYAINGMEQGHYLHALASAVPAQDNDKPISVKLEDGCIALPQVFDTLGTRAVRAAIEDDSALIVLDELGLLEEDAKAFQTAVFAALDSKKPVLGVLKQAEGDFINALRRRSDVQILPLNASNFDSLLLHAQKRLLPHCLVGDHGDRVGQV